MAAGEASLGSLDYNSEDLLQLLQTPGGMDTLLMDNVVDQQQLQQLLEAQNSMHNTEMLVQSAAAAPAPPMHTVASSELPAQVQQGAVDPAQSGRPYVRIVEQPKARGQRFRYKCEGRSAGSIPGEKSINDQRTFPTIEICNYNGPSSIVVVSCVTKDDKPRPHPHNLVGQDCSKGVCTIKLKGTNTVSFPNIGIQCTTKKEVQSALAQREKIRVDPFGSGYFVNIGNIDLNVVRLCFQVFLPDEKNKYTRIVDPVVSQPIFDKKAVSDLVICRVSRSAGTAKGGDEVFMLVEKVNKDDIHVRFFELSETGDTIWEGYADLSPSDVHRQFAIVFKTPRYRDPYIKQPVSVHVQLKRPSDNETSDAKPFLFTPDDPDPDAINAKRRRKSLSYSFLTDQPLLNSEIKIEGNKSVESMTVKERLKLKASRPRGRKTQQKAQEGVKQYTFAHTGGMQHPIQATEDITLHSFPNQFTVSAAAVTTQQHHHGDILSRAGEQRMLTDMQALQPPQDIDLNHHANPVNSDNILKFLEDSFPGDVQFSSSDLMQGSLDFVAAQETVDDLSAHHLNPNQPGGL
uniref:NF-kappaB p65 protein n=1 Tax=Urechis unicinctus TaxID=6432 RepID=A0A1B0VEH7_UREUN|nr:NF-kappaB p65 protein [Urechis unicinctus]